MKKSWLRACELFVLFIATSTLGPSTLAGCIAADFKNYAPTYHAANDYATRPNSSGLDYSDLQKLPHPKNNKPLRLTLDECVRMALEQNHDIHLVREALVQAKAEVEQARSVMLPFLGAEASYTRLDKDLAFALGPQSITFMEQDMYKAGIVLRQPIFMGGRLQAARRAAEYSRAAKAQETRSVQEEIVFQVSRAYWTAQVAKKFQKVAAEAVRTLKAHKHDVAILVREGAAPKIDLLRTQTELANSQKQLNVADNALDLALSALKNLLVVPLNTQVILTEGLSHPDSLKGDLGAFTGLAISKRPELLSLKNMVAAAKQGLRAAIGEYLPNIGLEGRYEYLRGEIRELEGDYHWTVGVFVSIPLWNWGQTAAKVKKARSKLAQAKTQLQKTEDRIRLEVRRAFLELGKAEKNLGVVKSGLESAREAFRLARVRYQAGEGTNADVLDARTALSRAEANCAQALFEYNLALAALRRATGTTDVP